jgi:hypothetical protein
MKTTLETPATVSTLKYTRAVPFDCTGWGIKTKIPGSLKIRIRLNDECGNGHEDFSITADITHPTIRRDGGVLACGCQHDEIMAAAPEFAPFIVLHLCDAEGVPMHAMANGFYWLAGSMPEAFPAATRPNDPAEKCAGILASHFRMTPAEVAELQAAGIRDAVHLSAWMESRGYRARWQAEASAAIATLEGLTGARFKSAAVRRNWEPVAPEVLAEMQAKEAAGYYLPEQAAARDATRREAEKAKRIAAIHTDHDARVAKSLAEMQTKLFLAENDAPAGNVIYYSHTNTLTFNWNTGTYTRAWTREEFEELTRKADPSKLPAGLKFEFKP